jgi:F-type H+-transporting ATPase subunit b
MPMRLLALLAAETQAGAPSSPFEVNPGLIIWTWLVFIVLFFILKKYAWPSILRATEEREQAIERQLHEAERMNTEAKQALEENRRLLAETKASVHQMLAQGKTMGEKERAVALEKTRLEQEELLARARREIGAERERAVADLRRETVELSLAAAAKLIGRRLDSDADRALVMEYLGTLGQQN